MRLRDDYEEVGNFGLADHQPVEQVADGGQVLLDRRRQQRLRLQLDLGGQVQRLHRREVTLAPAHQEGTRRPREHRPGARADCGSLTRKTP